MDTPDAESIGELAWRIDAKDVDWFQDRYRSGDLAWVEKRVGSSTYNEMGGRIDSGDLGWVGTVLLTLRLPGFEIAGPLLDMAPPEPPPGPAPVAAAQGGKATRGATLGAAAARPDDPTKRRKAWLLLPLLVVLGLIALLVTRCGDDDGGSGDKPAAKVDLVASAAKAGNLTKWTEAVDAAGLTRTLKGKGPFTVFAPSDQAFNALGPQTLDALFEDKDVLAKVVNFHVVAKNLRSADLKSGSLVTVEGSPLTVTAGDGLVKVGDATVISEIASSNGVLHTVDKVLVPPSVDLASLGRGTIKASADESGALTVTGTVGSQDARRALIEPLEAALPGRVIDMLTVDPDGPNSGFRVNLVGGTREKAANELRSALGSVPNITVNDQLQVTAIPQLEADMNALLRAEPIQFDTGSATIRSASNPTLDKAAALMTATPTGNVLFEGHTDSAGSAAKNLALSEARAEAVKAALLSRGVDPARLSAKGYGSERPIADNKTPDGRQKNRRVEALVTS